MGQKKTKKEILKRVFSTIILVTYSYFIFYRGPAWLTFTTFCIQLKCFSEIIDVAYNKKIPDPKIAWYLVFTTNYFLYCECVAEHYTVFINQVPVVDLLVQYHRFIAFCLYLFGLIVFLMKQIRRYDLRQFKFLAFIHVLLIIIVLQTYMAVDSIFNGIIWLLSGSILVTANDIFAFFCGRLFGKTPLIEVSPKKTWEGFIGGAIGTIFFGIIITHILSGYDYLVCPVEYKQVSDEIEMFTNCTRPYVFHLQNFEIRILDNVILSISTYSFVFHSLVISLFASIIGPFGGFFASGFKRACNVKNFGNTIPGHGGVMDRFDCFYLMLTFLNVYLNAFVKTHSIDKVYQKFLYMSEEKQMQFFYLLHKSLEPKLALSSDMYLK